MSKTFTQDDVIQMLRVRQGERSMRALAKELGISPPYLSDVFAKQRKPGKRILKALGLEVETRVNLIYRRVA